MAKKLHASEIDARARIARASAFSVYMYFHRARYVSPDFGSMAAAAAHAADLEARHAPKRALIYADCEGVRLPVPDDLRAAASAHSRGECEMENKDYSARSAALRALKKSGRDPKHHTISQGTNGRWCAVPNFGRGPLENKEAAPIFPPANETRRNELKRATAEAASKKGKSVGVIATMDAKKPGLGKRAQAIASAEAGKLPSPPDFSAETHTRFRPRLAELVSLVKKGDIKALEAFEIKAVSTSPKAMARYRDLAVVALKAKKAKADV